MTAGARLLASLALRAIDLALTPLVVLAGLLLKGVRRASLHRLSVCAWVLEAIGMMPIRRHYYEPFVGRGDLRQPLERERNLPGIDWNIREQLGLLRSLRFAEELRSWASPRRDRYEFRFNNGSFESGDAEYLYQIVRLQKPRHIVEIGSGNSSRIIRQAIEKTRAEVADYRCRHVCIEPFEAKWLEAAGIEVIRKRVEYVDQALFQGLGSGDLLFIDSSHVIRPQGDVLTEYLEILPTLNPGVIVHVHDVFSPRDYPPEWVIRRKLLWNEQYLLECCLSGTTDWKVIGALNFLHHNYFDELKEACPYLTRGREPGSFYMQKRGPVHTGLGIDGACALDQDAPAPGSEIFQEVPRSA